MIIGIGGEKGGCGKTTLATNIAALAANRGINVGLIDADLKCDAWDWSVRRGGVPSLAPVKCIKATGRIDYTMREFGKEVDLLIVDTGGYDSDEMRIAAAYSTVFFAPIRASIFDWKSLDKVSQVLARAESLNPQMRAFAVLSAVSNHPLAKSTARAREELAKCRELKCLDAVTHALDAYVSSADTGRGVCEMGSPKAQADIQAIVAEAGLWR